MVVIQPLPRCLMTLLLVANPSPPNKRKSNNTNKTIHVQVHTDKENKMSSEVNKQFKDQVGTKNAVFLNIIY